MTRRATRARRAPWSGRSIPEQTSLGDGAWSWFADPRAVHHRGRTYVGWVAQDGDIKVSAYDHATLARTTALVASRVEIDDHANPAVQILPDGRVRAFYSAHGGTRMWYRTSLAPEDITAWGPAQTMPENSTGSFGFTYPNPVHLAAEGRTYLFWRGGDFNPTFTSQADGSDAWAPVRRLISVAGERPYVKYDSDGESTIHIAFTNAHPNESGDVNIYYAAYRDGAFRRADGTRDRRAWAPRSRRAPPTACSTRRRTPGSTTSPTTIRVARCSCSPSSSARRCHAGSTIATCMRAGRASAGRRSRSPPPAARSARTRVSPTTAAASRSTTRTRARCTSRARPAKASGTSRPGARPTAVTRWRSEPVTAGSGTKNVRPVSPRGMLPFSGDMSVLWMRGRYPYYLTYQTSIATILRTGGDEPPVADAAPIPRRGLAPLAVAFDGRASQDTEGPIADHRWDFGDGASASGAQAEHIYTRPGRYFPKLTVTDAAGRSDTYVTEVVVDAGWPPAPRSTSPAAQRRSRAPSRRAKPPPLTSSTGPTTSRTARPTSRPAATSRPAIDGLTPGTRYRYRLVVTTANGTTVGDERAFTAGAPTSYREAVRSTPGLLGHWRLGDAGTARRGG